MVESAIEFADICRSQDFHNFVFSMKASNPLVMVQSYRLLAAEQYRLGWDYPLHLGVTEAGEGEDGRMKSAIGIGSLLADGLGDTVRVSLTEDPEFEYAPMQSSCRNGGISLGCHLIQPPRLAKQLSNHTWILVTLLRLLDGKVLCLNNKKETRSMYAVSSTETDLS